jgi:hypothetical protein
MAAEKTTGLTAFTLLRSSPVEFLQYRTVFLLCFEVTRSDFFLSMLQIFGRNFS